MGLELRTKQVVFRGAAGIDEVEALFSWLQGRPQARVNLADCTHLHPANLQLLLAAGARVSAWPRDDALALWLKSVLTAA